MKNILLLLLMPFLLSCGSGDEPSTPAPPAGSNDMVVTTTVLSNSFVGNGPQWGGYDMVNQWTGSNTLSEADWNTLYQRVRFMRPPLVRIMVSPGWNYIDWDTFDPQKSAPILFKILDFCQQENIAVMFGEWGHGGGESIDQTWLNNSVSFFEYLINTKKYTCINYFNMVNEPNGDWSSTKGNYTLWKNIVSQFHAKLVEKGLDTKVKIIGPDVAVWDANLTSWVKNADFDLGAKVGAYDIHTYPTEAVVRSGTTYFQMLKAYKTAAPAAKDMLMGELGFKYDANSELGKLNRSKINADQYASDDSNMMVYESFYATDMADAVIQNMRAGYAGVILWDLDDAMYNLDSAGATKLKRWGFWNILGAEKFGNAADENIRPWFYTMSLLCRYFPTGAKIYDVALPDKVGLRAIVGEKDGKYTIAVVNSHGAAYKINLKMDNGTTISNAKVYGYIAKTGAAFEGDVDTNGFAKPKETSKIFDFSGGKSTELDMQGRSFYLITNMD